MKKKKSKKPLKLFFDITFDIYADSYIFLAIIFLIITFFNYYVMNLPGAPSWKDDITVKFIGYYSNINIFIPSLGFVVLALFPSFESKFSQALERARQEGENTKLETMLNHFVFIVLWALINIGLCGAYWLMKESSFSSDYVEVARAVRCLVWFVSFWILYETFRALHTMYMLILINNKFKKK